MPANRKIINSWCVFCIECWYFNQTRVLANFLRISLWRCKAFRWRLLLDPNLTIGAVLKISASFGSGSQRLVSLVFGRGAPQIASIFGTKVIELYWSMICLEVKVKISIEFLKLIFEILTVLFLANFWIASYWVCWFHTLSRFRVKKSIKVS